MPAACALQHLVGEDVGGSLVGLHHPDRGVRGELPTLPEQEERAWLCYYLTPVCNRIWSCFTPQPFDFDKWVLESPAALFATPEVQDILESLETDVSVALIRHRRNLQAASL